MATSYSGTPTAIASRMAAPPMSPMREPCLMTAISSADLIMRMCMVGTPMSANSEDGKLDFTLSIVAKGM